MTGLEPADIQFYAQILISTLLYSCTITNQQLHCNVKMVAIVGGGSLYRVVLKELVFSVSTAERINECCFASMSKL